MGQYISNNCTEERRLQNKNVIKAVATFCKTNTQNKKAIWQHHKIYYDFPMLTFLSKITHALTLALVIERQFNIKGGLLWSTYHCAPVLRDKITCTWYERWSATSCWKRHIQMWHMFDGPNIYKKKYPELNYQTNKS